MAKGSQRLRRTEFELTQQDAWWRTAWLLAEVHNCAIAQIQAWGGAKDAKPVRPKDMNPLEIAKEKSGAISSDYLDDDGKEIRRE